MWTDLCHVTHLELTVFISLLFQILQCCVLVPSHGPLSVQAAELVTLTEACKLACNESVIVYTDSRYAFDSGALWKCRNILKSDRKPVLNHTLEADLLEAILPHSAIAVCKCSVHTTLRIQCLLEMPQRMQLQKLLRLSHSLTHTLHTHHHNTKCQFLSD